MSITWKIPPKSRPFQVASIFEATFNVPTPGFYDFTVPANRALQLFPLNPGAAYLIERISIGGNITEEQFLESMDIFPTLQLSYSRRTASGQFLGETVFSRPLQVVNYTDNTEICAWVHTERGRDSIVATFEGRLRQLPSMIGIAAARIQTTFSIYEVPFTSYQEFLKKGSAVQ
ncbi:MAG: hypothetical protein PHS93_08475 [Candidatus Omnitrophica bacterium]|jgi:hypothetical protein|nr:hypothetical protein [Candidatus Omnitrophota bacterium]